MTKMRESSISYTGEKFIYRVLRQKKTWRAFVPHPVTGKKTHVGYFLTKTEAIAARDAFLKENAV